VQAQVAELRELEKQFPEPTLDVVLADWQALRTAANDGSIHQHTGKFVAFCEGKLVGVGDDPLDLRIRLAKQYRQHPERFAVTFHGDWRSHA
jgi:hypothetical protein